MKSKQFSSFIVTLTLAFGANAQAQDKLRLFANADANTGKTMHTQHNCAACHQQRTEKNEAAYYTRADRKVSTQEKLIAQVAACSAQLKLDLFPEDELDLAAYLNREYYKLK